MKRTGFELAPGQIVLISAGFRLESEINGEWAARMLALADSDGGDKLGPFAAESMATYFADLDALLADANLRAQRGAELQQRFEAVLDIDRSGRSLLAGCELARQRFAVRASENRAR